MPSAENFPLGQSAHEVMSAAGFEPAGHGAHTFAPAGHPLPLSLADVGYSVGWFVGAAVGAGVGLFVGSGVVGLIVGSGVVGEPVGARVGGGVYTVVHWYVSGDWNATPSGVVASVPRMLLATCRPHVSQLSHSHWLSRRMASSLAALFRFSAELPQPP